MHAQYHPVSVLTVNNGLGSGTVLCGLYDSRGYMWFGTREGLHRYDGKHVTKYSPDPTDSTAIRSAEIVALAEDSQGRIFLAGRYIEVFLPEENRFQLIMPNPSQYYQTGPAIWLFEEEGVGVMMTMWRPVVFSMKDLEGITDYSKLSSSLQSFIASISSLQDDFKDNKFNTDLRETLKDWDKIIFNVREEKQNLWVTIDRPSGFVRIKHGMAEWIHLHGLDDIIGYPAALVFLDYNDSIAIAGVEGYGMVLFDKRDGRIIRHSDFRTVPGLSKFTLITPLCLDPAGRVWFSMMPYGVFVYDPLSPVFTTFKSDLPGSLLYNGLIRSMHCDVHGRLWIGFHDGYVQVFDPQLKKQIFGQQVIHIPHISDRAVNSIISLPNNDVLVNSQLRFHPGMDAADPPTFINKKVVPSPCGFTLNSLTTPKAVAILLPDNLDSMDLMIESHTRRIWNAKQRTPTDLTYITSDQILLRHRYDLYTFLYEIDDHALKFIKQIDHPFTIKSVYEKPGTDSLWLATTKGLFILDLANYTMNEVDVGDWPSKYLYSLVPDEKGNFWLSTNAGIIRYHPVTKAWKCFDIHDGMQSNEFNTNSFARLHDGTLAFGGPEGLNVFDPAYFNDRKIPFNVYLKSVSIQEKKIDHFNPFDFNPTFTILPDQKSIEFEYTSTQYFDREDLNYYIQLVGADEVWVNREHKDFVRYVNLPPGDYTLRIKACSADSLWSSNVLEAKVNVIPAYYQTAWFKALWVIALLALAYAFYRYRILQLNKLLQFRNRISRDIHDDVGSTLGSISIYSEVAKTASRHNRQAVLQKIGDTSREMIEKLNDIVWTINPDNDSFEKMESRIRNYTSMVLHPRGIDFKLDIRTRNHPVFFDMEKRRNLFLITKEAIYNASKYADCQHITILIEERRGKIYVEIADDGKGFDAKNIVAFNGQGMKSMRERAIAMQAKLDIISSPGQGTRVILEG